MDQSGVSRPLDVGVGFLPCRQAAQFGIDLVHGLSHKEAAEIDGIILTIVGFPAEAGIHNPEMIGLIDKVPDHV
jgi:hypothetical protein